MKIASRFYESNDSHGHSRRRKSACQASRGVDSSKVHREGEAPVDPRIVQRCSRQFFPMGIMFLF